MDARDNFVDVIVIVDMDETFKEDRKRFLGTHRRHAFRSLHAMMAFSSTSTRRPRSRNHQQTPARSQRFSPMVHTCIKKDVSFLPFLPVGTFADLKEESLTSERNERGAKSAQLNSPTRAFQRLGYCMQLSCSS